MQADPDKAVVFSDLTLMQRKNCFLILGPHTAVEATSVLHVVGYYRKLMVRNSKLSAANCYALPGEPYFLRSRQPVFLRSVIVRLFVDYKGYNCSELISSSRAD